MLPALFKALYKINIKKIMKQCQFDWMFEKKVEVYFNFGTRILSQLIFFSERDQGFSLESNFQNDVNKMSKQILIY